MFTAVSRSAAIFADGITDLNKQIEHALDSDVLWSKIQNIVITIFGVEPPQHMARTYIVCHPIPADKRLTIHLENTNTRVYLLPKPLLKVNHSLREKFRSAIDSDKLWNRLKKVAFSIFEIKTPKRFARAYAYTAPIQRGRTTIIPLENTNTRILLFPGTAVEATKHSKSLVQNALILTIALRKLPNFDTRQKRTHLLQRATGLLEALKKHSSVDKDWCQKQQVMIENERGLLVDSSDQKDQVEQKGLAG